MIEPFQNILPRKALITILKTTILPHPVYDNFTFEQDYSKSSHIKLEWALA